MRFQSTTVTKVNCDGQPGQPQCQPAFVPTFQAGSPELRDTRDFLEARNPEQLGPRPERRSQGSSSAGTTCAPFPPPMLRAPRSSPLPPAGAGLAQGARAALVAPKVTRTAPQASPRPARGAAPAPRCRRGPATGARSSRGSRGRRSSSGAGGTAAAPRQRPGNGGLGETRLRYLLRGLALLSPRDPHRPPPPAAPLSRPLPAAAAPRRRGVPGRRLPGSPAPAQWFARTLLAYKRIRAVPFAAGGCRGRRAAAHVTDWLRGAQRPRPRPRAAPLGAPPGAPVPAAPQSAAAPRRARPRPPCRAALRPPLLSPSFPLARGPEASPSMEDELLCALTARRLAHAPLGADTSHCQPCFLW